MSRFLLAVLVGSYALVGGARTMDGQEQREGTVYDAQAVRIESSWGNRFLVRGRDGIVVGKIGGRGGLDLATALSPSPNAVREAKEFNRNYSRGSTILAIGIVVWGVGSGVARMDDIDAAVAVPAWTAVAAGTFLIGYGGYQLNKAFSALARSVWWYNRDFGR
jgi:hypothetical protein